MTALSSARSGQLRSIALREGMRARDQARISLEYNLTSVAITLAAFESSVCKSKANKPPQNSDVSGYDECTCALIRSDDTLRVSL